MRRALLQLHWCGVNPVRRSRYVIAVLVLAATASCSRETGERQKIAAEQLQCPPPATEEFSPWGENGLEHICKLKHGPFVTFEQGHVRLRGQYANGKEAGTWRWYGNDGKVEREETY